VDNSQNPNDGSFLNQETKDTIAQLLTKFPAFPVAKVIGIAIGKNKHPDAILYSLKETMEKAKTNPGDYFLKILERTSGNLYEDDFIKTQKNKGNIFYDLANDLKKLHGGGIE
jgi:hypothetical protein